MKKVLSALLAVLMTVPLLAACGESSSSKYPNGEINVLNWGEYIADGTDGSEDILTQFEEEFGIKINYKVCPDNETLYTYLKQGDSYDVIIPSDYMLSRLIEEDMLEKLNFDNIPNFSDVSDTFVDPPYDPTNEYSVPYMWGTVGIIYNTTMVQEDVTSWSILFDEDYADQILMINNPRDAIGVALKYLGYSYNTTDKAQITEAVDLLVQQKPLVQTYVMDEIFDKLESGEAAIGVYYAGDYLTMLENNEDLAFCVPEEGSNYFVDAMCIPKGAANKENAEKAAQEAKEAQEAAEAARKAAEEAAATTAEDKAAAEAAAQGAENSKNFVSKFGRAKSYGTQTIGTPDAGATSMSYFFQGLAQA